MTVEQPEPEDYPKLTMRDVAERLGVSTMTVSRAMRGAGGVSEATRSQVLAQVHALGYRRNANASRLRSGRAHQWIGLVVTNLANPFYSQLAVGVEEVAAEHGARIVVSSTGEDLEREREAVRDLTARQIAGLIVAPAGDNQAHLTSDNLERTPVVLAASPPVGIDADCVLVDDFGGTREACRRLLARGHRRISFLGLPAVGWTGSERFRGYVAALKEAGLDVDERYVSHHRGDIRLAELATRALLALPQPPTALITANNRNTVGALRAVRGTLCDVAIAGFDDIELGDMLQLPLTVIAYDPADVGRACARLLFDRLLTSSQPQTQSLGRPPQRITIATTVIDYPQRRS